MINIILGIIFFIIAISIVVVVHEFGHMIVAKRNGVKCFEFTIGLGPRLFKYYTGKDGTEYTVRMFPIGGAVFLAGEEEVQDQEFKENESLASKTPWQKIKILGAGVTMNFILGWVLLFMIGFIGGIATPADSNVVYVTANTPAANAGLQSGDQIVSVDGVATANYDEITTNLENKDVVDITYKRDGEETTETIEKLKYDCDTSVIGISPETIKDKFNLIDSFKSANQRFLVIFSSIGTSLQLLTNGSAGVGDLMGPVGIASEASSVITLGLSAMFSMIAFLSINIGVVNILPIPALDGGRIVLALIELISRKKIPEKFEIYFNGIGFLLLMGLFVFVTFADVGRIGTAEYYTLSASSSDLCVRDLNEFEYTVNLEPIGDEIPEEVSLEIKTSSGIINQVIIDDEIIANDSSIASLEFSGEDVERLNNTQITVKISLDSSETQPIDIMVKVKDEKNDTINQAYTRVDR